MVVSNRLTFSEKDFKYFIGYKDNKENKPFMHILSRNEYI